MAAKDPTALILGATGQDGALLARHLVDKGWRVTGTGRDLSAQKLWRHKELDLRDQINLLALDLRDLERLKELMAILRPTHIYHLAGESFVASSFEQPKPVLEANIIGTLNVLEAVREDTPESRMFFTSSSEIFGQNRDGIALTEESPPRPANPYGLSKLTAQSLVEMYRSHHGLHACSGIMFNHESQFRSPHFVTRKIAVNMARLKQQGGEPLRIGNFDDARDFGSADEFTRAMFEVLSLDTPTDFVFATGVTTPLKKLIKYAAVHAGFSPVFEGKGLSTRCFDKETGLELAYASPDFFRPSGTPPLVGNPSRLRAATTFEGKTDVKGLMAEMVEADLKRRLHHQDL